MRKEQEAWESEERERKEEMIERIKESEENAQEEKPLQNGISGMVSWQIVSIKNHRAWSPTVVFGGRTSTRECDCCEKFPSYPGGWLQSLSCQVISRSHLASPTQPQRKTCPIRWGQIQLQSYLSREICPTCLSVPLAWTNCLAWLNGSVCLWKTLFVPYLKPCQTSPLRARVCLGIMMAERCPNFPKTAQSPNCSPITGGSHSKCFTAVMGWYPPAFWTRCSLTYC